MQSPSGILRKINEQTDEKSIENILYWLTNNLKGYLNVILSKEYFDHDGMKLHFKYKISSAIPDKGFALFIVLHDHAESYRLNLTPEETKKANDANWEELLNKYTLPQGTIWLVLRSPTDEFPYWTGSAFINIFRKFIEQILITGAINHNQIFLVGEGRGGGAACGIGAAFNYMFTAVLSFSGYGFYTLVNTYNTPYYIDGIEKETDERKKISLCKYKTQFKLLEERDSKGYAHIVTECSLSCSVVENRSVILQKFLLIERVSLPQVIVWYQGELLTTTHFYWLAVLPKHLKHGTLIIGLHVGPNIFQIYSDGVPKVKVRFNKYMGDLEKPFKIYLNGDLKFFKTLDPQDLSLLTYDETADPFLIFTHEQIVSDIEPKISEN